MRFTFKIEKLPTSGGPIVPVRTVTLDYDIIKIGSLPSSHLLLDDAQVSRMHAVIETDPCPPDGDGSPGASIIDLGSAAGTIVNGKKINQHRLRSGDILTLGRTRIIVSFQ